MNVLMVIGIVMMSYGMWLTGCGSISGRMQADEEFSDCLYYSRTDSRMSDDEKIYLVRGCQAVHRMRLRRLGVPDDLEK